MKFYFDSEMGTHAAQWITGDGKGQGDVVAHTVYVNGGGIVAQVASLTHMPRLEHMRGYKTSTKDDFMIAFNRAKVSINNIVFE